MTLYIIVNRLGNLDEDRHVNFCPWIPNSGTLDEHVSGNYLIGWHEKNYSEMYNKINHQLICLFRFFSTEKKNSEKERDRRKIIPVITSIS